MITYNAVTRSINVTVSPVYIDGQSNPVLRRFVFGYFIRIVNEGEDEVQLLRRHWIIRDAHERIQEVEGAGVIGQQPVIKAGEAHEYSSYCVLETFEGNMEGTYMMQRSNGERFKVNIPRFFLRAGVN
jgi:ApaG protein